MGVQVTWRMIDYETITERQAKILNRKIWAVGHFLFRKSDSVKTSRKECFGVSLKNFCKKFEIEFYTYLPIERYDEALEWLNGITFDTEKEHLKAMKIAELQEKKDYCKELVKKAKKELGINEIKMLNFAFHELPLPKRVMSLSKLSYEQLDELRKLLFKEK